VKIFPERKRPDQLIWSLFTAVSDDCFNQNFYKYHEQSLVIQECGIRILGNAWKNYIFIAFLLERKIRIAGYENYLGFNLFNVVE
jgi:hypothetical protein